MLGLTRIKTVYLRTPIPIGDTTSVSTITYGDNHAGWGICRPQYHDSTKSVMMLRNNGNQEIVIPMSNVAAILVKTNDDGSGQFRAIDPGNLEPDK